ncbi:CPBP family intramembrane metalloprotease [bacterium]|nr:CPBP family intramembrane metalloprotease [bacterium]MBU1434677.1 CPBP family intramembrane metalloprotease [bacterium]MBU1502664.1 CPBP family intramembrane metalloprotease [bacterium]
MDKDIDTSEEIQTEENGFKEGENTDDGVNEQKMTSDQVNAVFDEARKKFKSEIRENDRHFLGPTGVFFMSAAALCFMVLVGIGIYGIFLLLKIPPSSPWVMLLIMILSNLSFVFLTVLAGTKLNIYKETVNFQGKINLKIILLLLFLLVSVFFGAAHLEILYQRLISWAPDNSSVEMFANFVSYDPAFLILILFATSVIAPVSEEMFFRGLLVNSLRENKFSPVFIVVYTSVLFSIVHLQLRGFVMIFVIGSVCAILSLISKSLRLSIIFHSIYNTLVIAIGVLPTLIKKPGFSAFEEVYKKEPAQMPTVFVSIAVFLVGAIISYVLLRELNTEFKQKQDPA